MGSSQRGGLGTSMATLDCRWISGCERVEGPISTLGGIPSLTVLWDGHPVA